RRRSGSWWTWRFPPVVALRSKAQFLSRHRRTPTPQQLNLDGLQRGEPLAQFIDTRSELCHTPVAFAQLLLRRRHAAAPPGDAARFGLELQRQRFAAAATLLALR